jgi:UrcA family protein
MKNPFVIAIVSALITAGALKAAPALAETPSSSADTQVSLVRTADLDLSSKAGQRQLEARIAQAAREVCGTPSDADLVGQNKARQCRHDAIAQATSSRDALLAAANRGAVVAVTAAR